MSSREGEPFLKYRLYDFHHKVCHPALGHFIDGTADITALMRHLGAIGEISAGSTISAVAFAFPIVVPFMFLYLIVGPFLKITVFGDVAVALLTFYVIFIWLPVILHFTVIFFCCCTICFGV